MKPSPDIGKHLRDVIGGIVVENATQRAVIEHLEKSLAEAKAGGSESPNGAQGADGSGAKAGE
jgi:hypothetical protein